MGDTDSANNKNKNVKNTILGYELTARQDALFNHLLSSIISFFLYAFLFACDLTVAFRHFKNDDTIWGNLTLLFMFAPSLACYIVTVSNWDLWPLRLGYGLENIQWFCIKTLEHLLFPVWSVWRFSERIFWSIEASRSENEEEIKTALEIVTAPRTVELYFFFQGFLQSIPQIFLQLLILMTRALSSSSQTVEAQTASIVFNLCKISVIATFYQRFKTQQIAGKQYPWFKSYKRSYDHTIDKIHSSANVVLRQHEDEPWATTSANLENEQSAAISSQILSQRRRSSDLYLQPAGPSSPQESVRETWNFGTYREVFGDLVSVDEPDFNIRRSIYIKGMMDDDLAGKMVSFCWWFCFLLARILALSTFAYFYSARVFWILGPHFIFVEVVLLYDVKTDQVKRGKAIFFLFIGLIYLFCVIEFKIKFKKAKFIYYGFFTIVYLENTVMCLIWWFSDVRAYDDDFWFRYAFYLVTGCSILSFFTMLFYLNVNKPDKVTIGTRVL